jgi:hypothetical protein
MPGSYGASQKTLVKTGFWPGCQPGLASFMLPEELVKGFNVGPLKVKVSLISRLT